MSVPLSYMISIQVHGLCSTMIDKHGLCVDGKIECHNDCTLIMIGGGIAMRIFCVHAVYYYYARSIMIILFADHPLTFNLSYRNSL